ncbi:hypothetical protein [Methylobacterium sp. JK268]
MTRYRARPSFTVEIKRTRNSPLAASEAAPKSPHNTLWAGTGLIEEAAAATQSGRFDADPAAPPARSQAAAPAAAPSAGSRRVLPSLIAPPEPPPPPPVPETEEDEPVFRRRPGRPPTRKPAPAPTHQGFVWPEDWPDEPPAVQAPAPAAAAPLPAPPPVDDAGRSEPARPDIVRPKRREDELRIGERWKRRLPRYCR